MKSSDLQTEVNRLEEIIKKDNDRMTCGSYGLNVLYNKNTLADCQIIEAYDIDGKQAAIPPHRHVLSKEIFYQIKGQTIFSDGTILNPGELKIIPPGEIHSSYITPGGSSIIIVHPVDPALAV